MLATRKQIPRKSHTNCLNRKRLIDNSNNNENKYKQNKSLYTPVEQMEQLKRFHISFVLLRYIELKFLPKHIANLSSSLWTIIFIKIFVGKWMIFPFANLNQWKFKMPVFSSNIMNWNGKRKSFCLIKWKVKREMEMLLDWSQRN